MYISNFSVYAKKGCNQRDAVDVYFKGVYLNVSNLVMKNAAAGAWVTRNLSFKEV